MQARNLTAKRALKNTTSIHQQKMRANTPGSVPNLWVSIPSQTLTRLHQVKKFNNCRMSSQAPGRQHEHKQPQTPHRLLSGECQLEPNNGLCHNKQYMFSPSVRKLPTNQSSHPERSLNTQLSQLSTNFSTMPTRWSIR